MAELDAGWPHGSQDAIGQAGEFLIWANLITQSGGGLHVFLPMLDRGIDAVIHRLKDGAYIAVQVKTRTVLHDVEFPIAVYENHLFTADQLVIGVHLDGDRLGPFALVVDSSTFKKKAARLEDRGRILLVADVPTHPIPGHRWTEDLVALDHLAERLVAGPPTAASVLEVEVVSDEDRVVGFWGEEEVCRRLAMGEDWGLFRPYPDNETAEILVRRLATGRTVGIQVKTSQLEEPPGSRKFYVHRSSFVGAPTTFLIALAWVVPERRFHETCLVIPTEVLPSIAAKEGAYYAFHFRPAGSRESSRLDRYRIPLETLNQTFAHHLS